MLQELYANQSKSISLVPLPFLPIGFS